MPVKISSTHCTTSTQTQGSQRRMTYLYLRYSLSESGKVLPSYLADEPSGRELVSGQQGIQIPQHHAAEEDAEQDDVAGGEGRGEVEDERARGPAVRAEPVHEGCEGEGRAAGGLPAAIVEDGQPERDGAIAVQQLDVRRSN